LNFRRMAGGCGDRCGLLRIPLTRLFPDTYTARARSKGSPRLVISLLFLIGTFFLSSPASFGQSSGEPGAKTGSEGGPTQTWDADLFQRIIANQKKLDAQLDIFERVEKTEFRKSADNSQPAETKVWRVFPAGTGPDKILVSLDGKPISADNYRTELEKLEKQLIWAAQTGPAQRDAYAKLERKRKERNDLIDSTQQAFVFTPIGEETREGRVLAKYSMTPNPTYKPSTRNEMLFTKVEGTVWVDAKTSELARIEGHVTEDISIALFLAKVYKGSYFMQERYELEPGIWLPTYQQYDFDGRKFLSQFSIHERTFYTKYRRVGPAAAAVGIVRAELDKGKNVAADP
jgi:hypothetical protein